MAEIEIKEIMATVIAGVRVLAKKLFKEYRQKALSDVKGFLLFSRERFKRWTAQLALGNLSKVEFTSLVNGQAELMKMKALKQVGIAEINLDRFRSGMVELITESIFSAIGMRLDNNFVQN